MKTYELCPTCLEKYHAKEQDYIGYRSSGIWLFPTKILHKAGIDLLRYRICPKHDEEMQHEKSKFGD